MPDPERPIFNPQTADRFLGMVAGLKADELTEQRVKGLRGIAGKNEVAVLDALADRLASSRGRGDEERMRQDLQVAHFLGLDETRENDKLPDVRRELRELRQEYLPEVSPPWSISRDLSGWEFLAFFLGRGYPVEELLGRYNLSKEQVLDYKSALESGDPSVPVDFRWRFGESQLSEEGGNELIRVLDRRYPGRPVSQLNEEEKREVVEEVMPDLAHRYPREVLAPNTSEFEPAAGSDAGLAQDAAARGTGLTDPNMMKGTGIPPADNSRQADTAANLASSGGQTGIPPVTFDDVESAAADLQPDAAVDAGSADAEPAGAATISEPRLPGSSPAEIRRYSRPWQKEFGSGRRLGSGASGTVFRPDSNPRIVIKVFDKAPDTFQKEWSALLLCQSVPGVVRTLGSYQPYGLSPESYIVKEFIDGENMFQKCSLNALPIRREDLPTEALALAEEKQVAKWLISALGTLDKIHFRGRILNDFKFSDWPWDPQKQRAVLIDLGNMVDTKAVAYTGVVTPHNDIMDVLKILFYATRFGTPHRGGLPMQAMPDGDVQWGAEDKYGFNLSSDRLVDLLESKANELGACMSLKRIIAMMKEDVFGSEHSAAEYVGAMEEYFYEVGLGYIAPARPAGAAPDSVSPAHEDETGEKREVLVGVEDLLEAGYSPVVRDLTEMLQGLTVEQVANITTGYPLRALKFHGQLPTTPEVRSVIIRCLRELQPIEVESYLSSFRSPISILTTAGWMLDRHDLNPETQAVIVQALRALTPEIARPILRTFDLWAAFNIKEDTIFGPNSHLPKPTAEAVRQFMTDFTPEKARQYLQKNPKAILTLDARMLPYFSPKVQEVIQEEAAKITFKLTI